jgi:XTP/dITP diphosphohydrolase
MKIIFATNNKHKLHEISHLLGNNFELLSLDDIGCKADIPETMPTLEGNALQKANYIYNIYQTNCFADDTGLEVEALNGEPGVYSARYAGPNCNAKDNVDKLLLSLNNISNRKARFRCVIAYINQGKEFLFEGIVNGNIINTTKGSDGFGYDPIFIPEGYTQTFAEMPLSEKNKISHRAIAFNKFLTFLQSNL